MDDDELLVEDENEISFQVQEYVQGSNGAIPELPEDYEIVKGGYRSREF